MTGFFKGPCPVCGGNSFSDTQVLWSELIEDWGLSRDEVEYINRQQGFHCKDCSNNLRSMALAAAILESYNFAGTLMDFTRSDRTRSLRVLEINEAGGLAPILSNLPGHRLARYPEHDMTRLDFNAGSFDLVIHSDTLEHVPQPVAGLAECKRVISNNGRCIFTVPVIVNRMSRSRIGLKKSYHGNQQQLADDFIVHTEFGSDFWCFAAKAGFPKIMIHILEYPAGLAVEVLAD